ncbi:MAG: class I SAM-dependent DNA methyltransferase, partial [Pirellulales bacterium]
MTPHEFIAKWKAANLSERSACQQHFLDLCDLLGQPKPADADPDGAWYTFERGVQKTGGGQGWADVWMRGHFGWEYKGKHKDLAAAYQQLLRYREDLDNPPLLVVCDLDRFEIHTNFTGTAKRVYAFNLDGLDQPANLDVLRMLFTQPDALRPGQTAESITRQAAERFGLLADGMRQRGIPAPTAAHFLMKLMFCMFAEDIGLLPPKIFHRLLAAGKNDPARLAGLMRNLFAAMAKGGDFGADPIAFFNGGLFADAEVIELTRDEIRELVLVNEHDWASVEPSIFGTLFERTLDPAKRSQIGAHYTSREDIETLLKPVLMAPLLREWDEVRAACDKLWPKIQAAARQSRGRRTAKDSAARKKFDRLLLDFVERLAHVSVLDPASGSGNFLYVAIHLLLDLNKQVISYAAAHGLTLLPQVRPTQLAGLEINPYAQQLAQVVIWIGYLQWMHDNGFAPKQDPVLEPIESIRLTDAILDLSDPEHPKEPEWPKAEFIVGNPPFLGDKKLRAAMGDDYVGKLFALYGDRLPNQSDICCYWFEKAREAIKRKRCRRAGLLATQGIRGGANRDVLKRIKKTGDIFFAESDRPWVLDGANVHVSMVGFDDGSDGHRVLDERVVEAIHPNLSGFADTTRAQSLKENAGIFLRPPEKGGKFELSEDAVCQMFRAPNPNQRPNSDVLRPWVNAETLVKVRQSLWIIDFPNDFDESRASQYEVPFRHLDANVREFRSKNRYEGLRRRWWLYRRPGDGVREAQRALSRVLWTPMVSKHRVFTWMDPIVQPDKTIYCFARSDDYFFGVLHSRLHEVWARAQGTQVRERESGFRYTPTTCFETFPLPDPSDSQREAIAEAARELDQLRAAWLNPPEWTRTEVLEFPGSVDGPWARYVEKPDRRGIGTVRYPRLAPLDADCAKHLARRTLTNLYNER